MVVGEVTLPHTIVPIWDTSITGYKSRLLFWRYHLEYFSMSSAPTRFTSGFTQDAIFQPLGQIGIPDPFFYATYADDFLPYTAGSYTVTATSGSVAAASASGTGGRILMTTGATATNFAEIQQGIANFAYVAGKKLAYLVRVNAADVINSEIMCGLIQTTTTPFTVSDGIYFHKAAGATAVTLSVVNESVVVGSITMPSFTNSSQFTANADQDLAFYVDRNGNVKAFMGYHLIGQHNQNRSLLGPTGVIRASTMTGAINGLPINPTVAVRASTSAAQTMSVDFQFAAQER